jgi:hypothetical protein
MDIYARVARFCRQRNKYGASDNWQTKQWFKQVGVELVGVTSDNRLIQHNETSSSVNSQVKIVKNHSEGRVKLDSEDNKTIQNENKHVLVKKLEVTINRGHKQTVAIER